MAKRAAEALRKHGWEVRIEPTQSAEHVTELARRAVAEKADALLVSGGDGSVKQAVPGLLESETALGVLPSGTANVWARELGLPGLTWRRPDALTTSARLLATGQTHRVDVGLCNEQPFLLWNGLGLDALAVHHLETRRKRWHKHIVNPLYAAIVLRYALTWPGMQLTIESGGKTTQGRFLLGLVSNIRTYAGGLMKISPHARLNDGRMDLWLFEEPGLGSLLHHAWSMWTGRHVQDARTRCISFREARVTSPEPIPLQLDGDPLPPSAHVRIKVLPGALRVLVPASSPADLFTPSSGEYPA